MTTTTFLLPKSLQNLSHDPLCQHIADFAACLLQQGYSPFSIRERLHLLANFLRWHRRQHDVTDIDRTSIDRFIAYRKRHGKLRPGDTLTLGKFFAARSGDSIGTEQGQPAAFRTSRQRIADDYRRYLLEERGLSPVTTTNRLWFIERYLQHLAKGAPSEISRIRPTDVIGYVQQQARDHSRFYCKELTTSLRSFFRFLRYQGQITTDLAACVPTVANWALASLPRYLSAKTVQHVLDRCERKSAPGQRNYAILLLLARLGLRGGEVAALSLDDIDWETQRITVRGKGGHSAILPLPADVTKAIAIYVQQSRPHCAARQVFLRQRAPITGLGSGAICILATRALRLAEVDRRWTGAHVFRHSLATDMLNRRCSLAEIGEILRHKSPDTTAIYAKVNLQALRTIALAWPGGAR